ncbi:MAG: nucleoporin, partial [Thioalkalispiraceae bacterium]
MDMVFSHYFRIFSHSILFILLFFTSSVTAQEGLLNSGFEQGEAYWNIVSEADSVSVVEMEDGDDSPTYADLNITVNPDKGAKMLRLGAPKQVSENMNVGGNTVSQTFNSNNEAVVLSFRLFSWEHRERDTFTIDVKQVSDPTKKFTVQDRNGGNLSVTMFTGETAQTCTETPCVLQVYGGKQGDFVNTGWQRIIVSGLPTDGSEVTITYSLDGVNDEGHPSWAYVDSWVEPPVSKFSVSRTNTVEGNIITLIDVSESFGEFNAIQRNKWEIHNQSCTGDNCTRIIENSGEVILNSPDEGIISAKLTVYDKYGLSDTSTSGSFARDLTYIPDIKYVNGKIYMSVLNQEVLAGSSGNQLLGRFIDPGWEDNHSINWTVGQGTITEDSMETYQVPMLLNGIALASYDAPATEGEYMGWLYIDDGDGGGDEKEFVIKSISRATLETDAGRREPNNTPAQAVELKSGWSYLSNLHEKGDIDLYKVVLPDGGNIPNGSGLLIKLSDLPQDYDLIVLRRPTNYSSTPTTFFTGFGATPTTFFTGFGATPTTFFTGFGATPTTFFTGFGATPTTFFTGFGATPTTFFTGFGATPTTFFTGFGATPVFFTGFGATPVADAMEDSTIKGLWLRDPRVDPFSNPQLRFSDFPLSEMDFALPGQDEISSKDINLSEVGLGNLEGENLSLVAMSSNRGLEDEHLLLNTEGSNNEFIIAVTGNNGAFSPDPYTLQIETSLQMSTT